MTETRTYPTAPDYRPITSNDESTIPLSSSDDGGVVYSTRTAGTTITVAKDLAVGWRCRIVVASTVTGIVTVAMASGVTGLASSGLGAAPWSLRAGSVLDIQIVATNVCVGAGSVGMGPALVQYTRVSNTPLGSVALASTGTDAVSVAGTIYFSDIVLDTPMSATGLACLNGTIVGTDNVIYALWDSAGAVIRTTALAGALSAVADVFQEIAFTSAVTLPAGRYWGGFQVNGTTAAHQTIATLTYQNSTGSVAGAFGTIPAITPTTTKTAGVGPFFYLYT